jgi:glycosyltransferase involved in cell wall biosynthesis
MQILYVTSDISWPPSFGGEIRRWNILQGLLQAGETDVIVFRPDGRIIAKESFAGCGRIVQVKGRHLHFGERRERLYKSTLGRGALTLGNALPFEYQGEARGELRAQLGREVDFESYDLVWFATARAAVPIGRIDARATVLDGDDFGYVREWLLLRSSPWYGAKVWNYLDIAKLWWWERSFPRHFAFVVRCSQEDRDRHPAVNVVIIPNGTVIPPMVSGMPQRRVLFVGDLSYAPNFQGIEWFLDRVWPLIQQCVPDVALDIVGKNPPPVIQQAHGKLGVVVHGFVKDLASFYQAASLSIVPLHAGGGTRLKILESLANVIPVVSTSVGAFGIDAYAQHGLDRADTPDRFAACCEALLLDTELGRARAGVGREFVRSEYDWRIIQQRVADLAHRAVVPSEGRSDRPKPI